MAGVVADRVVVELEAKLDRYSARVDQAVRQWSGATKAMRADSARLEAQMTRSMGSIRTALLSTAAVLTTAFGVGAIARLADSYTRFTNQLKLAGLEGTNLAHIQNELFTIAQRNGVPLESLGTLYGRVAQTARELGASQQQLLQFTSGVAAALRIQGGDAASTSGALLQLSQALGGAIVRAEEFNSINEGARPILVAVASGMEKYSGSVARLRADVIEGKVSSREFFEGFLRGSAALEQQATRANLTISQSFTVLGNAFTKYIGEADAAHGATQRISQAIQLLANNLETVIPALVQIAGLMGAVWLGRFAAGMVAASAATGVMSTVLFAVQARAIGAATSMEALALAGRAAGASVLAAFGGPVGLAVAAFAVGMYYVATATDEATEAVNRNVLAAGEGAERYRMLFNEAQRAREANEALGRASATTGAGGLHTMTGAARQLEAALRQMGLTAEWAMIKAARATLADARGRLARAQGRVAEEQERGRVGDRPGPLSVSSAAELRSATAFATDAAAAARETTSEVGAGLQRYRDRTSGPPTAAPASTGGRTGRGRAGQDPADITRRFENEVGQLESQVRDATAQLLATRTARVDAELANIEADRLRAAREIEGNEHFSDARKEELSALNDRLAILRRDVVLADNAQASNEEMTRLAASRLENETELAQIDAQMAETNAERRASALRLLDLSQQRERLEIEAALQARNLSEVEERILNARLAHLNAVRAATARQIERDTEGPLARYRRDLNRTAEELNEDFERVAVDGLDALNDGLAEAIAGTKSLGDVFKSVANQIIADLLRIAIQQAIIKPLAELLNGGGSKGGGGDFFGSLLSGLSAAFGGGGGGGGSFGSIGAGFKKGRASGGHVSAGTMYRVNEGMGGLEAFSPGVSGKVVPLGRMSSASAGGNPGAPVVVRLIVGPSDYFDVRVQQISGAVAVDTVRSAAPSLIDASVHETFRRASRPGM